MREQWVGAMREWYGGLVVPGDTGFPYASVGNFLNVRQHADLRLFRMSMTPDTDGCVSTTG